MIAFQTGSTLVVCPKERYTGLDGGRIIVSVRDDWLRDFFVEDVRAKQIPFELRDRLFRKLQLIDDATTDQDLRVPPSNRFEQLQGKLAGCHSIRVNKQWRFIFE